MSTWLIYIPRRGQGVENFDIALARGLWGAPSERRVEGIAAGDDVLMVLGVQSTQSPPPRGYPRLRAGMGFEGVARLVVRARATSATFESHDVVWSNGDYPWRFTFEEAERLDNVILQDYFRPEQLDAMRRAAITSGQLIALDEHDPSTRLPSAKPPIVGTGYRRASEDASTTPPSAPIIDPDLVGRGRAAHSTTQNALADFLKAQGIDARSPLIDEPQFDVMWRAAGVTYVAEVKSTTAANEESQLRLGLGQVLRYRHITEQRGASPVVAVLVPEREPNDPGWLDLCDSLGMRLVWPGAFDRVAASS